MDNKSAIDQNDHDANRTSEKQQRQEMSQIQDYDSHTVQVVRSLRLFRAVTSSFKEISKQTTLQSRVICKVKCIIVFREVRCRKYADSFGWIIHEIRRAFAGKNSAGRALEVEEGRQRVTHDPVVAAAVVRQH